MSGVTCPMCEAEDEAVDYIIEWRGRPMEFECQQCGAKFDIEIEFEPSIWPVMRTIQMPSLGDPEV